MAFKLAPKNEVKTKVTVEELGDLGKVTKSDFIAIFRKLPTSEIKTLTESLKEGETTENDAIKASLIGWEGVLDEDKNEIPFNDDNLEMLIDFVEARKALAKSFWYVQSGEKTRKN